MHGVHSFHSSHIQRNKKKWVLFSTLQAVGCPYLDGMDEAVVSEVMFTPGEARLRVLTWLTGR